MLVFLTLLYVVLLAILVKIRVLPNRPGTWLSTIVYVVILFLALFIPLQWGAPSGQVRVFTNAVQIIPNVNGQVIEIAAEPNVPLQEGDVLFRLDPEPFELQVALSDASLKRVEAVVVQDRERLASAQAQLESATVVRERAERNVEDTRQLVEQEVVPANRLDDVETNYQRALQSEEAARAAVAQAQAELGALMDDGTPAKLAEARARLATDQWNLDQSVVRAPSDGYVTTFALTVGQRLTSFPLQPAAAFIDTSQVNVVGAQINQIHLRYVTPGQPVEMAFKTRPGVIVSGTVEAVIPVASQGQLLASGNVMPATPIRAEPFGVRIALDDPESVGFLPPGSVGTVAIYTDQVSVTHIIRKVMIRMESNLNYVNPLL